jgi:hypothetical protein
MSSEQLTDRIEQIAKQARRDFNQLIHEIGVVDSDARWNVRVIVGQRIGECLVNQAPIVMDEDDETLMAHLRPHTTDDPA